MGQSARTYLERNVEQIKSSDREGLIKHALLALRECLPSESSLTQQNTTMTLSDRTKLSPSMTTTRCKATLHSWMTTARPARPWMTPVPRASKVRWAWLPVHTASCRPHMGDVADNLLSQLVGHVLVLSLQPDRIARKGIQCHMRASRFVFYIFVCACLRVLLLQGLGTDICWCSLGGGKSIHLSK